MLTPLISIIVPIYNIEKYLDTCIQSIISQSYSHIEIILVDDGSTDNCSTICDYYASIDNRIIVIHKANNGLVSARKAGVAIATGEYVACVDGDDWISHDYIENFVQKIIFYEPDILMCNFYRVRNKSFIMHKINYREGYYTKEEIKNSFFEMLIRKDDSSFFAPSIWAKVFKLDLYRDNQLSVNDEIKIGEDGACTIPCLYKANSFYFFNNCLYYYRDNPEAMTKGKKMYSWSGPKLLYTHIQKELPMDKFNFQEQLYRKTTHGAFDVALSQFYGNKKYKEIVKNISKELEDPIYNEAIKKSKFSKSFKALLMSYALKKELYFLIYLYSKIK